MKGVRLNIVKPGGAADAAGLLQGDIVAGYGDIPTPSEQALLAAIERAASEQWGRAMIHVIRDGESIEMWVQAGTLGAIIGEAEVQFPQGVPRKADDAEAISRIVVTTAPSIEGSRVIRTLDIVSAEHVMGVNIFRDVMASVRNIVGGRSKTMQNAMREAKQAAIDDLRSATFSLGGNAVIATRIEYNEFSSGSNGLLMLAAYGTAVLLEGPQEPAEDRAP